MMKRFHFTVRTVLLFLPVFLFAQTTAAPAPASAPATNSGTSAPDAAANPASAPASTEQTGQNAESAPQEAKKTKPLLFRHGFLYSAEISREKPVLNDPVKGDDPGFREPVWAAVIFRLPANRGISRMDYELTNTSKTKEPAAEAKDSGKTTGFPCMAIALESAPFSMKPESWVLEPGQEYDGKFVRMLFALPSSELNGADIQTFYLHFLACETEIPYTPLFFRILPEKTPLTSDVLSLGENGTYGLSWKELHPQPAPAPSPAAAPASEQPAQTAAAPAAPAGTPGK